MTDHSTRAEVIATYWDQLSRHLGRQPCWLFPDQIRGDGLHLRRLDFHNLHEVIRLFVCDNNPYIDSRFQNEDELFEYVLHQLGLAAYNSESGAVDYLIVDTPGQAYKYEQFDSNWLKNDHSLPEGAGFAGLLHLYDLRQTESLGHEIYPPKAGIMISENYRGKGVGRRAMNLLQEYVRRNHHTDRLQVEIKGENAPSLSFFDSLGYRPAQNTSRNEILQLKLR